MFDFVWVQRCAYKALGGFIWQQVEVVVAEPAVFRSIDGEGKGANELVSLDGNDEQVVTFRPSDIVFIPKRNNASEPTSEKMLIINSISLSF